MDGVMPGSALRCATMSTGGDLAQLYGYVNRSLPDAQLDAFVDALATRIASFDKQAIAETKRLVDLNSLPSDAKIVPEWGGLPLSGRPGRPKKDFVLCLNEAFTRLVTLKPGLGTTSGCSVSAAAGPKDKRGNRDEVRNVKHGRPALSPVQQHHRASGSA